MIVVLLKYGKNWEELDNNIPSRKMRQIRTHAQKFLEKLQNDAPEGIDPLEYLKTKPPDYFLHFGSYKYIPNDDKDLHNNHFLKKGNCDAYS